MDDQTMNQTTSQSSTNSLVNSYTAANSSVMQAPAESNNTSNSQKTIKTIIGVFESRASAEKAVDSLRQQGFTNEEINIISKKQSQGDGMAEDDIVDGTLTGGTIGGIGGLLMGAGVLVAFPGLGPILAAGPIAAALGGAVAGGITGGLIDWGIPAEESQHYEHEVVQGSIIAIIRTNSEKVNSVAQILRQNGAKEVKSHSK